MRPDKRVVIDTNTLVSALIKPQSIPEKAVRKALDECSIFVSDDTLEELQTVLFRSKFDRYFETGDTARERFFAFFVLRCVRVEITKPVTACLDPKDDKFLSVAVAANAETIVSGDKKHLLSMNPFRGIQVVSAAEFLKS